MKIEKGVIWKKYTSIPYERIQNVDIYRGILDRILGLSDLQIQTAGLSASYYSRGRIAGTEAEGRLPGLARERAEQYEKNLLEEPKELNKPYKFLGQYFLLLDFWSKI